MYDNHMYYTLSIKYYIIIFFITSVISKYNILSIDIIYQY